MSSSFTSSPHSKEHFDNIFAHRSTEAFETFLHPIYADKLCLSPTGYDSPSPSTHEHDLCFSPANYETPHRTHHVKHLSTFSPPTPTSWILSPPPSPLLVPHLADVLLTAYFSNGPPTFLSQANRLLSLSTKQNRQDAHLLRLIDPLAPPLSLHEAALAQLEIQLHLAPHHAHLARLRMTLRETVLLSSGIAAARVELRWDEVPEVLGFAAFLVGGRYRREGGRGEEDEMTGWAAELVRVAVETVRRRALFPVFGGGADRDEDEAADAEWDHAGGCDGWWTGSDAGEWR